MIESMDTSHFKMLNRGRGRGVLVDNFHNDGIVKMGGGGGGGGSTSFCIINVCSFHRDAIAKDLGMEDGWQKKGLRS